MTKKELKKFCKLSKYLEQKDPELFGVFEDLCIMHYLRPSRGSSGLTFLYPKEKAYRDKIIKEAYGNDPNKAANMLRALIVPEYYASTAMIPSSMINLLQQQINVTSSDDKEAVLEGGLKLTRDEKFVTMDYRDNMSVFTLSGKGEISIHGPAALVPNKKEKTTGGAKSSKKTLQDFLRDTYIKEIGELNNIYVKKVALQLSILETHKKSLRDELNIIDYLGNDEFSDSYLLDMFCTTEYPRCFDTILTTLQNDERTSSITRADYIKYKTEAIGGTTPLVADPNRLRGIKTVMDIRQKVRQIYRNDEKALGKDLFIVFCNIEKDIWNTEVTERERIDAFNNFAYIASNVYTSPMIILKQNFELAHDLTLYGNLLKSDVCLFTPQATYPASNLQKLPDPLDMKIYSLSSFINMPPRRVGGNSSGKYDRSIMDGFLKV
jgi:hypothetical protein